MKVHEVLCLGIVVSAFGNIAWSAEPIRIVLDGRPRAAVVLPADAHRQSEAAARHRNPELQGELTAAPGQHVRDLKRGPVRTGQRVREPWCESRGDLPGVCRARETDVRGMDRHDSSLRQAATRTPVRTGQSDRRERKA